MTMTPTSSVPYRLKSHDAVFGEYSSKSLLLAANADAKPDNGFDDGLGDSLDSDGSKHDDDNSGESLTDETIAASLDALQRERAAIDAVLAELHDVKLQTETAHRDVPAADQEQCPKAAEVGDTNSHVARDDQAPSPRTQIDLDGGMVLLQPTGDANSNAYDLAAVYLHGLESTAAAPLGVEASVGMYQAIDVGTSQRVNEKGENVPLARPATAAGASVSAENAPVKKSEQPS